MLHILLIEDSDGDALLIREAIRTSLVTARVTIALDGERALLLLRGGFKPDLIILDLNLPKSQRTVDIGATPDRCSIGGVYFFG